AGRAVECLVPGCRTQRAAVPDHRLRQPRVRPLLRYPRHNCPVARGEFRLEYLHGRLYLPPFGVQAGRPPVAGTGRAAPGANAMNPLPDDATVSSRVRTFADGTPDRDRMDCLAVEAPLEVRIGGKPVTVLMRTPGHDEELVRGFLFSEGIIVA